MRTGISGLNRSPWRSIVGACSSFQTVSIPRRSGLYIRRNFLSVDQTEGFFRVQGSATSLETRQCPVTRQLRGARSIRSTRTA